MYMRKHQITSNYIIIYLYSSAILYYYLECFLPFAGIVRILIIIIDIVTIDNDYHII